MSKTMLRIVAIAMIVLIVAFSGCLGGDKESEEVEPTPAVTPDATPAVTPDLTPAATPAATSAEDIKEAGAEKGCDDLDQSVLRRYDHNKNGLIDDKEMENAHIGYESNYEKQSDYEQIVYAYDHKCPVEPKPAE